jgi:mono/diheme cytochrome c family protein
MIAVGVACLSVAGLVTAQSDDAAKKAMLERGKFIVELGGCNDCHTPWTMTANGPRPDSTKYLSGHPAGMLAPAPKLEMPWLAAASATFTAWAGPWGISYGANLTPDSSGLGVWTEDMFIQAMRTGKHWGVSRPIMPPMPYEPLGKLSDADLKSIFAYLQTIPPVKNVVPDYEPPAEAPTHE